MLLPASVNGTTGFFTAPQVAVETELVSHRIRDLKIGDTTDAITIDNVDVQKVAFVAVPPAASPAAPTPSAGSSGISAASLAAIVIAACLVVAFGAAISWRVVRMRRRRREHNGMAMANLSGLKVSTGVC